MAQRAGGPQIAVAIPEGGQNAFDWGNKRQGSHQPLTSGRDILNEERSKYCVPPEQTLGKGYFPDDDMACFAEQV